MDYQKYIIMFLICFCIGASLWFLGGVIAGVPQAWGSAGLGFGIGYTGMEIAKDYFKRKKNANKN